MKRLPMVLGRISPKQRIRPSIDNSMTRAATEGFLLNGARSSKEMAAPKDEATMFTKLLPKRIATMVFS